MNDDVLPSDSPETPPEEPSRIEFPPGLPISARVVDIAKAIDAHPVVIVAGATGSGKTTQLPKIALAMGRGLEKRIGITQPRRIAASSVAARIAEELKTTLGADVGYKVRFDDRTSPATYVKLMTDGILLAEIAGDPLLREYDTLIVDEAHERSLTIDFLLGYLLRILPQRPDLKVIISSATLETERFSAMFAGAPVIEVEGRTFPVEVLYEPPRDEADLAEAVADAVANVTSLDPRGDILVFLPGEREIRETERELLGRNLRHTVILPLYARLAGGEQSRVFSTLPERRVILATNVAETSLTLPGIVYVVDAGLARLSRYDARSGTTRLQIEGISQASAEQRKGRCGRVREGICIRLYDEQSYNSRPAYTDPEIKRTGLAGVILRMKALGLGDVDDFPFLDPPSPRAVTEGYRVLEELGALGPSRELLPLGERLARFPVDPRIGRMILAGIEHDCLREVLVVASALSVQDPRERPREHQQKADDLHRRFRDERSDFVGLVRLFDFARDAEKKGRGQLRRTCKDSFLSYIRVREWFEVHRQLEEVVADLDREARGKGRRGSTAETAPVTPAKPEPEKPKAEASPDKLHLALLTGLLSKVGQWNPEQRVYVGAKQTRFVLHPSSSLAKKTPAWVMAFELVETSQLFARTAAKIEPEWLLTAGAHLLKRSYAEPHWSEKTARAKVKEHATLFGLHVFRDRSVDYAPIAPEKARLMFLDHALVRGEYVTKGAFFAKNQTLLGEVATLRDKARKSDMLADDDALLAFFDKRVPEHVLDGKSFETWREKAEPNEPGLLLLKVEDVLVGERAIDERDYPDSVVLHGATVPVKYVFDPSADDDGITLTVPLVLLPQLSTGELTWSIPGRHEEKIAAMLYELPRAVKREIGAIPELARTLVRRTTPFEGSMIPVLTREIEDLTGYHIPEGSFRPDLVASYLRNTVRIVDAQGKTLAASKDLDDLFERFGQRAKEVWKAQAPARGLERTGLVKWDFGDLPEVVTRTVAGTELRSYPALVDKGASVELVLRESRAAAEVETRAGLRRLVLLVARSTLSAITPRLPPALPNESGAPLSRVETEAFRSTLLERIVDHAFELETRPVPRDAKTFDALVAEGLRKIDACFRQWADAVAALAAELDRTQKALRTAAKHPSGTVAIAEMRGQLARMIYPGWIMGMTLARLAQLPRYLKAMQARLGRAVTDPRKDAAKLEPFAPLWTAFLAKASTYRDVEAARALRWELEELRVAIFAPELKPIGGPSIAKAKASLAALR